MSSGNVVHTDHSKLIKVGADRVTKYVTETDVKLTGFELCPRFPRFSRSPPPSLAIRCKYLTNDI